MSKSSLNINYAEVTLPSPYSAKHCASTKDYATWTGYLRWLKLRQGGKTYAIKKLISNGKWQVQ